MMTTDSIRVLHVDDERDFAEVAAAMLEQTDEHITVESATSAQEGLDRLDEMDVDCIVSDYNMPGTDGIEFLETVREEHPDLPFILFTGKGSEEIASEAISAGVTDYLQKKVGKEHYDLLANRIRNVVEGYRTQQVSNERKRRLETLISNLPGIVYRCRNEPTWPMELVEGECESLTGYQASVLEDGDVVWGEDVLHPDDREPMWEAVQEALASNDPFEVTYRIVTRDGTTKWMWERGQGVYEGGDLIALEGFITDITERKRRERELTETNRQLQGVLDTISAAIFMKDTESRYLLMNQECREWLGIEDQDDIVGMTDEELVSADLAAQFRADDRRVFETGETIEIQEELPTEDGTRKLLTRKSPVYDENGDLYGLCAVSTDITDQKDRERELDAVHERMAFGLDATDTVLWDVDFDGENTMHGPVERVYGVPPEAVPEPADYFERVIHPEDREEVKARHEQLVDGAVSSMTVEYRTNPENGDVRWLRTEASPKDDGSGETSRLVGLTMDITERKERERALERQNERLDAFANTVSYDLQSPLSVANGHLELVREECDSEHLGAIGRAHERMETLIEHLLMLAREGDVRSELDRVALTTVVDRSWESVQTPETALRTDADRTILADGNQLQQLFENLFRNAVEHGGSRVTVGTLDDGFYVADNGPGIPDDDRNVIFQRGYSTSDGGAGVGLSIVQSIAEAHDWEVAIEEGRDGGARFEITGVETP